MTAMGVRGVVCRAIVRARSECSLRQYKAERARVVGGSSFLLCVKRPCCVIFSRQRTLERRSTFRTASQVRPHLQWTAGDVPSLSSLSTPSQHQDTSILQQVQQSDRHGSIAQSLTKILLLVTLIVLVLVLVSANRPKSGPFPKTSTTTSLCRRGAAQVQL